MILLISDLHLEEERPDITRAFLHFLATRAREAEALYILGDFFEVWIGDELHFPDCTLRVTEPRQPCYKFNIVMGFSRAGKRMAEAGCSGFYLSVTRPGTIQAGQTFTLLPGPRDMSVAQMFAGKRWKHVR